MIFFLNATEEQLEFQDRADVEELFSKLIDADRRGRHYFVLPRRIASWALENLPFTTRQKSHLTDIKQHHATRGALPRKAGAYLEICLEELEVQVQDDRAFRIGVKTFLSGEYADTKAALVIEDLVNDAGLYQHLLNETRKLTNVPSFSFEPVHSGGSRILPVFNSEIAKEKVVCCLVDTDKIAPCAAKSATARQVLNVVQRRNVTPTHTERSFIGGAFCSVGHELENSIPFHIARDLVEVNGLSLEILGRIVSQDQVPQDHDCFWLFFDIKEGLCGATLASKRQSGHISEDTFQWLLDKLDIDEENLQQTTIEGFGDGIVQKFLNCHLSLKKFHEFTRTDYWKGLFLEPFELLLWFFAAPPRERI